MTVVWLIGVVVGLAIAVAASRSALDSATAVGRILGLSPFVLGMTVVAIGTDLPEIANSIVSSATGHGDLNVGNSIGSVVTQSTLVLGLLALTGRLRSTQRFVITTGSLTVLALLIGAMAIADEHLGRADALLLIATWLVGTFIIQRPTPEERSAEREVQRAAEAARIDGAAPEHHEPSTADGSLQRQVYRTIGFLVVVGAGAALAVECFTRAAQDFGVPEYLLSFFVLAAGHLAARARRRCPGAAAGRR